jgi:hypothetical protein
MKKQDIANYYDRIDTLFAAIARNQAEGGALANITVPQKLIDIVAGSRRASCYGRATNEKLATAKARYADALNLIIYATDDIARGAELARVFATTYESIKHRNKVWSAARFAKAAA